MSSFLCYVACFIRCVNDVNLLCFHSGMFGILWYVAWYVFAFDSPSVHPTITAEERAYIELSAVNTEEVTLYEITGITISYSGRTQYKSGVTALHDV